MFKGLVFTKYITATVETHLTFPESLVTPRSDFKGHPWKSDLVYPRKNDEIWNEKMRGTELINKTA